MGPPPRPNPFTSVLIRLPVSVLVKTAVDGVSDVAAAEVEEVMSSFSPFNTVLIASPASVVDEVSEVGIV